MKNTRILPAILILVCLTACTGEHPAKSRGPIVLGDSSTIVTETDPMALQDEVPDLKPIIATNNETIEVPPAHDTIAPNPPAPAQAANAEVQPPAGTGLTVAFKEVTLFIPGITTRSYGKPDLQQARGASYELTGGHLAGTQLRTSAGAVTKVSQRYETMIVLEKGSEQLPLESLGKYTSAWQQLTASRGGYPITGLEPAKLGYKQATPAAIRNAVDAAARRGRLSRKTLQEWQGAAKNVRAVNTPPARVVLRSVMWRVEGKGFSKELRIDIPLP